MPEETGFIGAEGSIVTVGTFDGVHRGHLDVLARLAERARETGLTPVLVTFEPHPLEVVRPASAPALLTPGLERLEVLVAGGIRHMVLLPFTRPLAALSAEQFVTQVLIARYGMRELLVGHDNGFGRGREGDADALRSIGSRVGFAVDVVDAVVVDATGKPISSSEIRRAVAAGELDVAADGLGRRYSLFGRVVTGARRGRTIGYPTLNLALPDRRKLLPAFGVYAVIADTRLGRFGGMMNLGSRPTFGDHQVVPEVHLFGVDADFYEQPIRVELVKRLRDVQQFPSLDALVEQLRQDAEAARDALRQVADPLSFTGSVPLPTPSQ